MIEECKHQRELKLGIPQTGACYVCCPWMFPNANEVKAREAYEQWHVKSGQPLPDHRTAAPVKPTPERRRLRVLWRKWNRSSWANRRAGAA